MSRRMVVRCDVCGKDANMVYPHAATSATLSPSGPFEFSTRDMKPHPPDGWFERWSGSSMRGELDLCSADCVATWDQQERGVTYA